MNTVMLITNCVVHVKGELEELVAVVASWLQSDTLGSSPTVARFFLFSVFGEEVEF